MSEILNIEQLKEMATPVIEIPGFDNQNPIKVRVKKPSLMSMFSEGKIPNHLLGIATQMVGGEKSKQKKQTGEEKTKELIDLLEMYCEMCLVEPTYTEFKEIMTDDQKEAIFEWGVGDVAKAGNFRDEEEIQSDNNDGKALQKKTK